MGVADRRRAFVARSGGAARGAWIGGLAAACLLSGLELRAETPAPKAGAEGSEKGDVLSVPGQPTARSSGAAGEPGLDDLLRLPSDFTTKSTASRPVAGASEEEWRGRFARAEKAIGDARETLAGTRRELDGLAETGGASQWSVAPPGASGGQQTTSPLSFKLRQELQRNREALDEAEKALRELRIEADLAGVPAEWRVVSADPARETAPQR